MSQIESEIAAAWEEVSFWQDYMKWWKAEHNELPEPRVLEALENAWRRYERALQRRERPAPFAFEFIQQPTAQTPSRKQE